jgi:D-alanyl-D-alanine carboxypeptidase (penicillin-binding protein 5/6)
LKKIFIISIFLLLLLPINVFAEGESLAKNARSAILIEATTGKVLFEKNSNERVSVASLTKMMGQILILEAIENGTLKWDEKITASLNASNMGGTQIWLQPNEVMTVYDLMKGVSMASANDAIVALAERLGGTELGFVAMMNQKAKKLGLKDTFFKNPTGLDEEGHYSSAYDMAMIAKELLKHEKILEFSSLYEDYLRTDTPNKFWLVNTNKLLRSYPNCDGLKTGFTDDAKYTMAVTAKRNNLRLIAIVLGEEVSKVRNQESAELLDYGFNLYEVTKIKNKNEILDEISIEKANPEKVKVLVKEDVVILKKKSNPKVQYTSEIKLDDYKLPLKKGEKIGTLIVKDGSKTLNEIDIVVGEDVKKATIFNVFFKTLSNYIKGEINI